MQNNFSPILNFILGILGGAIRDQARRIICQVVESTAIPSINKALANLPGYNVQDGDLHFSFKSTFIHHWTKNFCLCNLPKNGHFY